MESWPRRLALSKSWSIKEISPKICLVSIHGLARSIWELYAMILTLRISFSSSLVWLTKKKVCNLTSNLFLDNVIMFLYKLCICITCFYLWLLSPWLLHHMFGFLQSWIMCALDLTCHVWFLCLLESCLCNMGGHCSSCLSDILNHCMWCSCNMPECIDYVYMIFFPCYAVMIHAFHKPWLRVIFTYHAKFTVH